MANKDYEKIMDEQNKVKNCCPFCGHVFELDEVPQGKFKCPTCNWEISKDEFIGMWDDCAWDY